VHPGGAEAQGHGDDFHLVPPKYLLRPSAHQIRILTRSSTPLFPLLFLMGAGICSVLSDFDQVNRLRLAAFLTMLLSLKYISLL
jgi:hypothetical protein